MVDLHTHVLPGMDDGAADLEEALAMMRIAAASGTTDVVATPHWDLQFAYDGRLVQLGASEIVAAFAGPPRLHTGCEVHLTAGNLERCLAEPRAFTLAGSRYLLVELPPKWKQEAIEGAVSALQQAGVQPVFAHPERHPLFQKLPRLAVTLGDRGCLLQITASSLFGRFGKRAERTARQLLRHGRVQLAASDAHDTVHRPPWLREAYDYVASEHGPAAAQALFIANPDAVLRDEPLPHPRLPVPEPPQRSWFQFPWLSNSYN